MVSFPIPSCARANSCGRSCGLSSFPCAPMKLTGCGFASLSCFMANGEEANRAPRAGFATIPSVDAAMSDYTPEASSLASVHRPVRGYTNLPGTLRCARRLDPLLEDLRRRVRRHRRTGSPSVVQSKQGRQDPGDGSASRGALLCGLRGLCGSVVDLGRYI
jgi:hypothetical protein